MSPRTDRRDAYRYEHAPPWRTFVRWLAAELRAARNRVRELEHQNEEGSETMSGGPMGYHKSDDAIADALADCQKILRRIHPSRRARVLKGLFTWVAADAETIVSASREETSPK